MTKPYKRRKISQQSELPLATPAPSQASFFDAPRQSLRSQTLLTMDPAVLLLLTALVTELRNHNAIEILKLKREDDQKQSEAASAEKAEMEDQERFASLHNSLYS